MLFTLVLFVYVTGLYGICLVHLCRLLAEALKSGWPNRYRSACYDVIWQSKCIVCMFQPLCWAALTEYFNLFCTYYWTIPIKYEFAGRYNLKSPFFRVRSSVITNHKFRCCECNRRVGKFKTSGRVTRSDVPWQLFAIVSCSHDLWLIPWCIAWKHLPNSSIWCR